MVTDVDLAVFLDPARSLADGALLAPAFKVGTWHWQIVIGLAFLKAHRDDEVRLPWHRIVPLFLIGFVIAAATDTAGLISDSWHPALSTLGTFLITTALAGIGLSLRFADMRKAGTRPLLLGGLLWIAVAASSLGLQALTGL